MFDRGTFFVACLAAFSHILTLYLQIFFLGIFFLKIDVSHFLLIFLYQRTAMFELGKGSWRPHTYPMLLGGSARGASSPLSEVFDVTYLLTRMSRSGITVCLPDSAFLLSIKTKSRACDYERRVCNKGSSPRDIEK